MANDTVDLIDTDLWGQTVSVVRNFPTYSDTGIATDDWQSVGSFNSEMQPISPGSLATQAIGQMQSSSHRFYFACGRDIQQGDRIRPENWIAGNDEYVVNQVMDEAGHVEAYAQRVRGHG